MRLRLGCEMTWDLAAPTPMIALLHVHPSRAAWLVEPDRLRTDPALETEGYRDVFGNWCSRLLAPAGTFSIGTDGVVEVDETPDVQVMDAHQHAIEDLPSDALQFLLGSRYCETDRMMDEAFRLFGHTAPGWERVNAICEYVHNHIRFDYADARATRTAWEAHQEGRGVCRDFAHLAATFCRCMNIPTRYCNGYISDIGLPPPYPPMDFAAWIECFIGGRWHTFDPRNFAPRVGRVLVSRGRDAADVPLTHTFGAANLTGFRVWMDPLPEERPSGPLEAGHAQSAASPASGG